MIISEIIGKQFTRWTVIGSQNPITDRLIDNTRLKVSCICGKTKEVRFCHLKRNESRSCGCLRNELVGKRQKRPKGESGLSTLLAQYKHSAKQRNIRFYLTKEAFKILTSSNCYYCGTPPYLKSCRHSERDNYERRENATYIFNGIDRIDNDIGYVLDNCVTCCIYCNYSKRDRSEQEFQQWIDNLVQYRLSLKNE